MIQSTWADFLRQENQQPYAKALTNFLDQAYATKVIYPPRSLMYQAFELCPREQVKVVMIGQDPYHQPGQANGLAFSVSSGIPLPPSLKNIFKEIQTDVKVAMNHQNGDLRYLAKQGVLLLNSLLTVEEGKPLSHDHVGYQTFFEHVLLDLNQSKQPIVFLLWGSQAKSYRRWLTHPHHLVLEAHHPSPLSANRGGWFGCKHFSLANAWLLKQGIQPIQWSNLVP
jgi:uracil-DNA glycosylase